jgi:hypothetical protein
MLFLSCSCRFCPKGRALAAARPRSRHNDKSTRLTQLQGITSVGEISRECAAQMQSRYYPLDYRRPSPYPIPRQPSLQA